MQNFTGHLNNKVLFPIYWCHTRLTVNLSKRTQNDFFKDPYNPINYCKDPYNPLQQFIDNTYTLQ